MLEKIISAIIIALLDWLRKRYEDSKKPKDADSRPVVLARIGERVRRAEDSLRQGRLADESRDER